MAAKYLISSRRASTLSPIQRLGRKPVWVASTLWLSTGPMLLAIARAASLQSVFSSVGL